MRGLSYLRYHQLLPVDVLAELKVHPNLVQQLAAAVTLVDSDRRVN